MEQLYPGEPNLSVLADLYLADAPDGGVQIGVGAARPLEDVLAGLPPTGTISAVCLIAEERWRLGRLLLRNAPPEEREDRPGESF